MIIHLEHIKESEVEEDEALEQRDDDEEGRVEHGQPADGLDGVNLIESQVFPQTFHRRV